MPPFWAYFERQGDEKYTHKHKIKVMISGFKILSLSWADAKKTVHILSVLHLSVFQNRPKRGRKICSKKSYKKMSKKDIGLINVITNYICGQKSGLNLQNLFFRHSYAPKIPNFSFFNYGPIFT